jgi:dihydrofolate reductase
VQATGFLNYPYSCPVYRRFVQLGVFNFEQKRRSICFPHSPENKLIMGKLTSFTFVTLNGFYKGLHEDISWHRHGKEENDFAAGNFKAGNILLFGRVTYEMMAGYWPSAMAIKDNPAVAKGMNEADKIVFSTTMQKAGWNNTRLVKTNITDEIKKLKQQQAKDMTILGSGSLVTQFADEDLIDEYQVMIDPVALGKGTALFSNLTHQLNLKLTMTKTFQSGVVLMSYQPL